AADQAVAVAEPGDRVVLGEHVQQRRLGRELQRDGADDERGAGGLLRDVRGGTTRHKGRGYSRRALGPETRPTCVGYLTPRPRLSSSRRRPGRRPAPGRRATPPRRGRAR